MIINIYSLPQELLNEVIEFTDPLTKCRLACTCRNMYSDVIDSMKRRNENIVLANNFTENSSSDIMNKFLMLYRIDKKVFIGTVSHINPSLTVNTYDVPMCRDLHLLDVSIILKKNIDYSYKSYHRDISKKTFERIYMNSWLKLAKFTALSIESIVYNRRHQQLIIINDRDTVFFTGIVSCKRLNKNIISYEDSAGSANHYKIKNTKRATYTVIDSIPENIEYALSYLSYNIVGYIGNKIYVIVPITSCISTEPVIIKQLFPGLYPQCWYW